CARHEGGYPFAYW
nr:immunoglobulin heavy chain junction region [Mus musculus]NSM09209.1 immunoglobulin heavy chain junction region [Mus musculus]